MCVFERNVCRRSSLEDCAHMGLHMCVCRVCLRVECLYSDVDMFEVTTHTHPGVHVVHMCVYLWGCV